MYGENSNWVHPQGQCMMTRMPATMNTMMAQQQSALNSQCGYSQMQPVMNVSQSPAPQSQPDTSGGQPIQHGAPGSPWPCQNDPARDAMLQQVTESHPVSTMQGQQDLTQIRGTVAYAEAQLGFRTVPSAPVAPPAFPTTVGHSPAPVFPTQSGMPSDHRPRTLPELPAHQGHLHQRIQAQPQMQGGPPAGFPGGVVVEMAVMVQDHLPVSTARLERARKDFGWKGRPSTLRWRWRRWRRR